MIDKENLFKEYQKNNRRQMKQISLKLYNELEERNKEIWKILKNEPPTR